MKDQDLGKWLWNLNVKGNNENAMDYYEGNEYVLRPKFGLWKTNPKWH